MLTLAWTIAACISCAKCLKTSSFATSAVKPLSPFAFMYASNFSLATSTSNRFPLACLFKLANTSDMEIFVNLYPAFANISNRVCASSNVVAPSFIDRTASKTSAAHVVADMITSLLFLLLLLPSPSASSLLLLLFDTAAISTASSSSLLDVKLLLSASWLPLPITIALLLLLLLLLLLSLLLFIISRLLSLVLSLLAPPPSPKNDVFALLVAALPVVTSPFSSSSS